MSGVSHEVFRQPVVWDVVQRCSWFRPLAVCRSADPQPLVALEAESPLRVEAHVIHRQILPRQALPARLHQAFSSVAAGGCHGIGEVDIGRFMHHDLQLMAASEQLLPWRLMPLWGECDPVEAAAEWFNSAGLHMQRQSAMFIQGAGEGLQVVMKGFASGDHDEGRTADLGFPCFFGQLLHMVFGMDRFTPGVLCVAPGASHRATSQTDEKGAPAAVMPFSLK